MTYLIHTLSQTAAGRPIIALGRVEGAVLTIGRDPASDVHLTDLAVTRHHARLTYDGAGEVIAEATDNLPFDADGRSTERSVIRLATGGELRFGGYRVAFTDGNTAGEVVVTVERASDAADPVADRSRFALAAVAPGKRSLSWALALAILAAFLVWPIWSFHAAEQAKIGDLGYGVADAAWSPGKLSRAHGALERNCIACHQKAFVAVADTSCKSCHAPVHDHAAPARLAVARLDPGVAARMRLAVASALGRSPGRCVDCHTEHEGREAKAPTPQRFCADCHADIKARLPDTGLGDAGDFATAHPQFRPAIVVRPGEHPLIERVSLDAAPRQHTGLIFPHALHLSATNSVARMAGTTAQARAGGGLDCASCHAADGSGGFRAMVMEANCQSCHSLAFGRSGGVVRTLRHGDVDQALAELRDYGAAHGAAPAIGGGRRRPGEGSAVSAPATGSTDAAIRAVFASGGLCAECHVVERRGGGYRIAPVTLPGQFLTDSAFDHRAHAGATCASCHAAARSTDSGDPLMPGIATCRDCHAGAIGVAAGKVASPCALCHVYHRPPADAPRDHSRRGAVLALGRRWP